MKKNADIDLYYITDDEHEHVYAEITFNNNPLIRINIEDGIDSLNFEILDDSKDWVVVKLAEMIGVLNEAAIDVKPRVTSRPPWV